jgi:hypothetical protein
MAFWRTGVVECSWPKLGDIYQKKFDISLDTKIATAGSCFAQHISYGLRSNGYTVLDLEPPPPGLSRETAARYGYGLFSARYGNIYTVRHLLTLAQEAFDVPRPIVWEKGGRYFDAMRPSVEPHGLDSPEEVARHRAQHLSRVRRLLLDADILIFTFGLTEAWLDAERGAVFPTAPGVIAGSYRTDKYHFKNFAYGEVLDDFLAFQQLVNVARIASGKGYLCFILTVSPVPLTATASGEHVLVATTYSKSVLRAAAGALAHEDERIAYFPSYEIISSPWSARSYYSERNLREVTAAGVDDVMKVFFHAHGVVQPMLASEGSVCGSDEDVYCDEVILESLRR